MVVKTSATDTLKLIERLEHHCLTGLATVEATYQNSERVIQEFQKYFKNANTEQPKKFKTNIISNDNWENVSCITCSVGPSHSLRARYPT